MSIQTEHHRDLAEYFRTQADWRRAKTDEYPNDADRNAQSAAALDSLADYIASGDADVDALSYHCFAGVLGGQRCREETSRYGFGYAVKSHRQHDELLAELELCALADTYEELAEDIRGSDDETDSLYACEVAAAAEWVTLPDSYWRLRQGLSEAEVEALLETYQDFTELVQITEQAA